MQMSYLYTSDFPFKNFCKIAQHTEIIQNVWEKSNDMYSLSIRVRTTINQISIFTLLCSFFTAISWSNHKNYNFLACDWFKKVLFSTNPLAKLLSDSLLLDSLLLDSLLSDSSISQSHSKM